MLWGGKQIGGICLLHLIGGNVFIYIYICIYIYTYAYFKRYPSRRPQVSLKNAKTLRHVDREVFVLKLRQERCPVIQLAGSRQSWRQADLHTKNHVSHYMQHRNWCVYLYKHIKLREIKHNINRTCQPNNMWYIYIYIHTHIWGCFPSRKMCVRAYIYIYI